MQHLFNTESRQDQAEPIFVIDWFFYLLQQLLVSGESEIDTCAIRSTVSRAFLGGLWSRYQYADEYDDGSCEMDLQSHQTQLLKMLFELAFSVLMVIVLLQMVFGIIIDTFGSLREEQSLIDSRKRNFCFMCGIEKRRFEMEALKSRHSNKGFAEHIAKEHNIWDYFL